MKQFIPVLLGTTRKGNQSKKVAMFLLDKLRGWPEVESELMDLGLANIPMMEERIDPGSPDDSDLWKWINTLKKADGLIIVSPEYKQSFPGSLKNLMDLVPPGILRYKPVGICTVSSGIYGGAHCLSELRLLVSALGGLSIPDRFMVGEVNGAFATENGLINPNLDQVAQKFAQELVKYVIATESLRS